MGYESSLRNIPHTPPGNQHDMVAEQAAEEFNVTWSRTTPVVVSCLDDAKDTYITGEMYHRMDVNGTVGNVWAFRLACS